MPLGEGDSIQKRARGYFVIGIVVCSLTDFNALNEQNHCCQSLHSCLFCKKTMLTEHNCRLSFSSATMQSSRLRSLAFLLLLLGGL